MTDDLSERIRKLESDYWNINYLFKSDPNEPLFLRFLENKYYEYNLACYIADIEPNKYIVDNYERFKPYIELYEMIEDGIYREREDYKDIE